MKDVDSDVDYLAETMCTFVDADEFGDHACCLGAQLPRRDVGRKGRSRGFVAKKWTEKMDEEELEEHAVWTVSSVQQQVARIPIRSLY